MTAQQPVKLADCKVGDAVILRYRNGNRKTPIENWRLTPVTARTPKFVASGGMRFRIDGQPSNGGNRHYTLHDPTPEALAAVAAARVKIAMAAVARAAADEKQQREELDKSLKAAAWLANKSADELVAFLPGYALAGLWDTIEPRLETANAVS